MSALVSRQKKRAWETKFEKLTAALEKAQEDVLVAIHEAREDGLSQADIAYMAGGVAPSGIKAKAVKGEKIAKERKKT